MPIIRNSSQSQISLEEFYKDLTSENFSKFDNEIGQGMLEFISMVNETFVDTTLYGLTSHYSLVIFENDSLEDEWFIRVYSIGGEKFQFEYTMSKSKEPWKNGFVKGQANSIDEAKDFLIIAMTECDGWSDTKELKKLYDKLKGRKTESTKFSLWLEFEEVDPTNWDKENEVCNIHVDLEDGRHYGLNIWTYKFLESVILEDKKSGQNLNGLYQKPPDLFVKELTRECIQKTIEDLLKIGDLEKVLNSSIIG